MYGLYGFLAKMMMSGKLKFAPGRIEMIGDPMTMISMEAVKAMTEDAEARGMEGIMGFYYEGWVYGYTFTYRLSEALGLKTFEERYKIVMDIAALMGFGDFKTLEYYLGYAKFNVIDNPFAKLYYPSEEKHDHFLRGMNAGGGAVCHHHIINCVELECAAKTGKLCTFINANPIELKKRFNEDELNKQLKLDWLIPKQISLIRHLGHDASEYETNLKQAGYNV